MSNTIEPLWTVREVMAYLHASRSWVYRETEAGRLPCLRIGENMIRYEPEVIRAFARGVVAPPSASVVSLRNRKS